MPSHQRVDLSFGEKVSLSISGFIASIKYTIEILRTYIPRRIAGWPSPLIYFVATARANNVINIRAHRASANTSGDDIKLYAEKHGISWKPINIDCGNAAPPATLHEINVDSSVEFNTADETVLVFMHGGGYIFSAVADESVALGLEMAQAANASKILLLEYTLAPELKYPGQLIQAVYSVKYLIESRSYKPSQIILGGGSAGGNLVLAVLAHAIQPSPYAPALTELKDEDGKRLKGAVVISPWLSMNTVSKSYDDFARTDILISAEMDEVIRLWQPKIEPWAEQVDVPKGFWKGIPTEKILVTGGAWEVFFDQINAFAKLLMQSVKDAEKRVELVMADGEIHAQPIFAVQLGLPPAGARLAMIKWLQNL